MSLPTPEVLSKIARARALGQDFELLLYHGCSDVVARIAPEDAFDLRIRMRARKVRRVVILTRDLVFRSAEEIFDHVADVIDGAAARLRGDSALDILTGTEPIEFSDPTEQQLELLERAAVRLMEAVDKARKARGDHNG